MSGSRPKWYWDSCVFLAWLKNERRPAGEFAGIESCAMEVDSGKAQLITSAITYAEVVASNTGAEAKRKFIDLFKRPNINALSADIRVASLASELRDHYLKSKPKKRLPTPDALHLATAILYGADEFHTFDEGKRGGLNLLALSGNVGGHRLVIIKPGTPQQIIDFEENTEDEAIGPKSSSEPEQPSSQSDDVAPPSEPSPEPAHPSSHPDDQEILPPDSSGQG